MYRSPDGPDQGVIDSLTAPPARKPTVGGGEISLSREEYAKLVKMEARLEAIEARATKAEAAAARAARLVNPPADYTMEQAEKDYREFLSEKGMAPAAIEAEVQARLYAKPAANDDEDEIEEETPRSKQKQAAPPQEKSVSNNEAAFKQWRIKQALKSAVDDNPYVQERLAKIKDAEKRAKAEALIREQVQQKVVAEYQARKAAQGDSYDQRLWDGDELDKLAGKGVSSWVDQARVFDVEPTDLGPSVGIGEDPLRTIRDRKPVETPSKRDDVNESNFDTAIDDYLTDSLTRLTFEGETDVA